MCDDANPKTGAGTEIQRILSADSFGGSRRLAPQLIAEVEQERHVRVALLFWRRLGHGKYGEALDVRMERVCRIGVKRIAPTRLE